jgi:excisionase family DNA binding protein
MSTKLTSIAGKKKRYQPSPLTEDDQLLTFKEAMSYLRVSRSTLYRLMESGQLSGYKVGGLWRFYRKDLLAYIHGEELPAPLQLPRMA